MATSTTDTTTEAPTRRSITATRPLMGWRTVDIVTIAFLGAALGIAFWGWGIVYNGPLTALKIGYAPSWASSSARGCSPASSAASSSGGPARPCSARSSRRSSR